MLKNPRNFHRSQNTSGHLSYSCFFLYQTMSGDGGDGFKNRRRNEKMREDSAFKEDEAIFIIFQYGNGVTKNGLC